MYTGVGIEDALAALRLAEIEATALAHLERAADKALVGKCIRIPHSFSGRTPVVMADGSGRNARSRTQYKLRGVRQLLWRK
jgi:hypothetical protein